jgi:dynein intermediate chain 2
LYEEYFLDMEEHHEATPCEARTIAVFRDPNEFKRAATKISFHPEGPNKLAVSYSILQFQQAPDSMPTASYIWDVNNPNQPDTAIMPSSSALACLVFNPRSPDHLVGGSYNGLVGFWDLRKGSEPTETSRVEQSQ